MENLINNKKLQKILLWLFLLAGAAIAVAGLFYATNFTYYSTQLADGGIGNVLLGEEENFPQAYEMWIKDKTAVLNNYKDFVNAMNSANTYLFVIGVVTIVLFAILCIFGNKYRKKYYVSNLLAGTIISGVAIVLAVVAVILNIKVIGLFNDNKTILEVLKAYYDNSNSYGLNCNYITAANVILIISIVIFALNLVFCVMKYVFTVKADKKNNELVDVDSSVVDSNLTSEEAKI